MVSRPYRPSNGTEGEIFYANWCAGCAGDKPADELGDGEPCPILTLTFALDIDHPDYPTEFVEVDGRPKCTAFREEGDAPLPLDPAAVVRPLL